MGFVIISVIVISIVGTLSHFIYELSNHNKYVGIFAAVNESVWEHIKIALTPTLLWGIVDGLAYGTNPNYFLAKTVSLVILIIVIPLLFYGHRYVAKKDYFVFDIVIFYIAIIFSQLSFYHLLQIEPISFILCYLSCISLFIIFGCYMIFTLLPIKNDIFKDPLTNKYGYKGHSHEEK